MQWLIPVTTLVDAVSNDFVRRLPGAHEPHVTDAKNRTRGRRLGVMCSLTETVQEKCFYWQNLSHSAWPWRDGGEQTALKKQRVTLRGVYVWCVNSTVTKHSDYFVWKDTLERVTQRCDDKKRVNSCVLKYLFFWGSSEPEKDRPKTRKCSLRRATNFKQDQDTQQHTTTSTFMILKSGWLAETPKSINKKGFWYQMTLHGKKLSSLFLPKKKAIVFQTAAAWSVIEEALAV